MEAMEESLKKLRVDYIDLVLHHAPGTYVNHEILQKFYSKEELEKQPTSPEGLATLRRETWRALQDLKKQVGGADMISVT